MDKVLLVIDMQNDFVSGALENQEAAAIIPAISEKIQEYIAKGTPVFFTRDTHSKDYLDTQEGRLLPVPHCEEGTPGWQIVPELASFVKDEQGGNVFNKPTFGSTYLPAWIHEKMNGSPKTIELCGVCTDICVISNAMILKAAFPETEILVHSALCAGVTPDSHETALEAMKSCQIIVD